MQLGFDVLGRKLFDFWKELGLSTKSSEVRIYKLPYQIVHPSRTTNMLFGLCSRINTVRPHMKDKDPTG